MSVKELRSSLETILKYLENHWDFVNCHMVNFLTDNHWETFIPTNLRSNIQTSDYVDDCIQEVFWKSKQSTNFKDIKVFFNGSTNFRLENMKSLLTSIDQLKLSLKKEHSQNTLSIKEFMTEKKRHEVEITAELINDLVESHRESKGNHLFIVDAGDGKGYLSSRLSLQYDHKVLGIDFKETNTENAASRNIKLQRAWNGLTERAALQSKGITPPRRGKKQKVCVTCQPNPNNYKTINKFITTKLNFNELVKELFSLPPESSPELCLTGLHTCGNLSSTCIKVFSAQPDFRILCNIGCCYHLLKEEFSKDEFFGNKQVIDKQYEVGFPLSEYLRNKRVKMGRNARMLAAQSIHRTQNAKELPNKSLFYRALLEVLIVEKDLKLKDTVQVGKIKNIIDFKQYVKICNEKANLGLETLRDEYLQQVEEKFSGQAKLLDLFYLIRMCFAPVLETLIILDRLLFLKESGCERSYIIPLFDPVISPRHFCIVALK